MSNEAIEILKKHFKIATDVKENEPEHDDCIAHYWLINKDWPVIGATIVLSKHEYFVLKEIFDEGT